VTNATDGHAEVTVTVTDAIRVRGNDRLVAALAARGREGGATSLGAAVEAVFGNLTLVLWAIVLLAGLTSVGSVAATFAGAVHARRRTLGILRSTGAGPTRLLGIVLRDVLRIGAPAIVAAIVGGYGLLAIAGQFGYLTVFGIGIALVASPWLLAAVVGGAAVVIVVAAVVTTLGVVATEPARSIRGDDVQSPRTRGGGTRD
jgi:ABC-type antimicrobial peptide transport system permease subunit